MEAAGFGETCSFHIHEAVSEPGISYPKVISPFVVEYNEVCCLPVLCVPVFVIVCRVGGCRHHSGVPGALPYWPGEPTHEPIQR